MDNDATISSRLGFRLTRFELLNWGTFDQKIGVLNIMGNSIILTGLNGAGKSTVIDAFQALLVPHNKRRYNAVTGTKRSDRSTDSYILGNNTKEYDQIDQKETARGLRTTKTFNTVLLGVFTNEYLNETFTLVCHYPVKNGIVPSPVFYSFPQDISIKQNLQPLSELGRTYNKLQGTRYSTQSQYYGSLGQIGIQSEDVLALFSNIISLKEIDDITYLVRTIMLEPTGYQEAIDRLQTEFTNLRVVHTKLKDDRARLTILSRIYEPHARTIELQEAINAVNLAQSAARYYSNTLQLDQNNHIMEQLNSQIETDEIAIQEIETAQQQLQDEKEQLIATLHSNNSNQQAAHLQSHIERLQRQLQTVQRKQGEYSALCSALNLDTSLTPQAFYSNQQQIPLLETQNTEEQSAINDQHSEGKTLRQLQQELALAEEEYRARQRHKNNIPSGLITYRDNLANHCGTTSDQFPFIGELIDVLPQYKSQGWQPALEKLLYSFAVTILVSSDYEAKAIEYTEKLKQQNVTLRYQAVLAERHRYHRDTDPLIAYNRLDVQDHPVFSEWIWAQLVDRYNYTCCETQLQFRNEHRKAISKGGQIKGQPGNYVRYSDKALVLGADTRAALSALDAQITNLKQEIEQQQEQLNAISHAQSRVSAQLVRVASLKAIESWTELDTNSIEAEIKQTETQLHALDTSELEPLQDRMKFIANELEKLKEQLRQQIEHKGILKDRAIAIGQQLNKNIRIVEIGHELTDVEYEIAIILIDSIVPESERYNEDKVDHALNKQHTTYHREAQQLQQDQLHAMDLYLRSYPNSNSDLLAQPEYIDDFIGIYENLIYNTLPETQSRFEDYMRKDIGQHIKTFSETLQYAFHTVGANLERINHALKSIPSRSNEYLQIEPVKSNEKAIAEFQTLLNKATLSADIAIDTGSLETLFEHMDRLFNRLEEPGFAAAYVDPNMWRKYKMATFSSITHERIQEATSTSGSSGGEAAMKTYVILAAAAAYRAAIFSNPEQMVKAFRLLCIDEALQRLDPENAELVFQIFNDLGFQVILVTPNTSLNSAAAQKMNHYQVVTRTKTETSIRYATRELIEYLIAQAKNDSDNSHHNEQAA